MENRLLDILQSTNEANIDEAKLEAYLKEKLKDADKQALEEAMNADSGGMEHDALEGWLTTADKSTLIEDAGEINQKLAQQLKKTQKRVRKRPIRQIAWLWLLLGFILLLALLGWLIIYWLQN